jgi:hypothetical protein
MNEKPKQAAARPIFRWLAAITAPVFVVMAIVCLLGILDANGKPDALMTGLFAWGAVMFASIAATGRFEFDSSATKPFQLFAVAKKYANAEITLEEYGSRTKDIMQGK